MFIHIQQTSSTMFEFFFLRRVVLLQMSLPLLNRLARLVRQRGNREELQIDQLRHGTCHRAVGGMWPWLSSLPLDPLEKGKMFNELPGIVWFKGWWHFVWIMWLNDVKLDKFWSCWKLLQERFFQLSARVTRGETKHVRQVCAPPTFQDLWRITKNFRYLKWRVSWSL